VRDSVVLDEGVHGIMRIELIPPVSPFPSYLSLSRRLLRISKIGELLLVI
jgi:hypothetical protein